MYITFISIAAVVAAVFLTYRCIRRCKIREQFHFVPGYHIDKSCLMLTLSPCGAIIDTALECLSSHDKPGVCRNHRHGAETLEILGKMVREQSVKMSGSDERLTVYHEYMLENTGKIAETTRRIITSTDNHVSVSCKCEIEVIRDSLTRLLQSADSILRTDESMERIKEDINNDKDFIKHTIAVHSGRIKRDDYDDGAPAYAYLMLLYYIHSFVSSLSLVVKNIEIKSKPMTA